MKPAPPTQASLAAVRKTALSASLMPEHEKSLHALASGLMRPVLPDDHVAELVVQGLARHAPGGVMLTDAGMYKIYGVAK